MDRNNFMPVIILCCILCISETLVVAGPPSVSNDVATNLVLSPRRGVVLTEGENVEISTVNQRGELNKSIRIQWFVDGKSAETLDPRDGQVIFSDANPHSPTINFYAPKQFLWQRFWK